MTLGLHLNVVAILRSDEAGQALNAACNDINGTEVSAHVGRLLDVQSDVALLKGADVLILDVDPRSEEEMTHLRQVPQHEFPGTPMRVAPCSPRCCGGSVTADRPGGRAGSRGGGGVAW